MKRKLFLLALLAGLTLTGCQKAARDYGGTATINLKPGVKLEEITWKDESDLWYLTRPMHEGERAETHTFTQSKDFGIRKGTVIIVEHDKE